ncbi:MAG: RNA pyrophosphohydrolase [Rickettsiales bacterium]|nr:RNA pyrophosphohydrolase [Rickettsiales bacterium]
MDFAYRPGVGIMLINKDGLVFSAKRIDTSEEAWQMPQGGIDRGETPEEALWRELREETGTNKAEILHVTEDWLYYDFPNELAARLWRGRYRGQRQKWFALRFTGLDADINIETERPEFSEWQWVEASLLPDLIVPFKRRLYQAVLEEFRDFL